jgi:hypothetical protein
LSSYAVPSHSPVKLIGLPGFQSVFVFVPKRYFLIISGVISAFHTSEGDACMSTDALAVRFMVVYVWLVNEGVDS